VPTAEGRAFYREAEKALAAIDQIVDIARDIRTLRGAHLRVVAPMLTTFGILPAAVGAFRRAHPHTRVSLDIKDIRDIADWVANGPFDIGVTVLPFEEARVESEPLATVRLVLVMPRRHPLAAKRVVHARGLRGENMILPLGDPPRAVVCASLEAAGLKIESTIDASSALLVGQLVAQGLGLAALDPFTFKLTSGLGIVSRPLRPAIEFQYGLFFPRHRPRSALVDAFAHAVRSVMGAPRS
jgi:DNA-binding transcriptional LysR family regulator